MEKTKDLLRYHNLQLPGSSGRPILYDLSYGMNGKPKPIIIFCHGFKGFKDWGTFPLVADYFARNNYIFLKFNFSHNGATPDDPSYFGDLEAFGRNTFSKELDDLDRMIDLVFSEKRIPESEKNLNRIFLVGHSRGGGIAILKAAGDDRIKALVTWASVNDFGYAWTKERVKKWKEEGVMHVENARTKQMMPLYYSLFEDYEANRARLNIEMAVKNMDKPFMVMHGTDDEGVPFEHAISMKRWNPGVKLNLIPGGSHTFDGSHPWNETHLPQILEQVCVETKGFFDSVV